METIKINVLDFTKTIGGRFRSDGDFSGEEFRDDILLKHFNDAINNNKIVEINLDGTYGMPCSWIEEVFGGLGRKFGKDVVPKHLKIISNEEPDLIQKIVDDIALCNWNIGLL